MQYKKHISIQRRLFESVFLETRVPTLEGSSLASWQHYYLDHDLYYFCLKGSDEETLILYKLRLF